MSNRFTEKAEKALNNASNIAESLGHTYIGSEHILLSLVSQTDSAASLILQRNGVSDEKKKKKKKKKTPALELKAISHRRI